MDRFLLFFFICLQVFIIFSSVLFPPQATRTGPLSTEQHTVEVKAAVGCFKRLTCQKSQSYSTENNMHASSFNTSLFFLLRPIIKRKKKKSTTHTKNKLWHIFSFHFQKCSHTQKVTAPQLGATGSSSWTPLAGSGAQHTPYYRQYPPSWWRQATATTSEGWTGLCIPGLYREIKEHKSFLARIQLNVRLH